MERRPHMTRRKLFQVRKFYGEEWAVVDTKRNATLGVAERGRSLGSL